MKSVRFSFLQVRPRLMTTCQPSFTQRAALGNHLQHARHSCPRVRTQPLTATHLYEHMLQAIDIALTSFSGVAELSASFSETPGKQKEWRSTDPSGLQVISISAAEVRCTGCTLFLLVRGVTNSSSFSVAVSQSLAAATGGGQQIALVEGQPQVGLVAAGSYRYYSFVAPDLTYGLSFTLTAYSGSPILYLSSDGVLPTAQRFEAQSQGLRPLKIPPQSRARDDIMPLLLGVGGGAHPASFSLVARSGGSIQLLQNAFPFQVAQRAR